MAVRFKWQFSLTSGIIYKPHYDNACFFACVKTKTQISSVVTAQLISAFVFATQVIDSLLFLHPTFEASMYLLWLNSPICERLTLSETPKNFFYLGATYIMHTLYHTKQPKILLCAIAVGKHNASFKYSHLP